MEEIMTFLDIFALFVLFVLAVAVVHAAYVHGAPPHIALLVQVGHGNGDVCGLAEHVHLCTATHAPRRHMPASCPEQGAPGGHGLVRQVLDCVWPSAHSTACGPR